MKYNETPYTAGFFRTLYEAECAAEYINECGLSIPQKAVAQRQEHWGPATDYSDYAHHSTSLDTWTVGFGSYVRTYPGTTEKIQHCIKDFQSGFRAYHVMVVKAVFEQWMLKCDKEVKKCLKKGATDRWDLSRKLNDVVDKLREEAKKADFDHVITKGKHNYSYAATEFLNELLKTTSEVVWKEEAS